jgi:hypothetical protein
MDGPKQRCRRAHGHANCALLSFLKSFSRRSADYKYVMKVLDNGVDGSHERGIEICRETKAYAEFDVGDGGAARVLLITCQLQLNKNYGGGESKRKGRDCAQEQSHAAIPTRHESHQQYGSGCNAVTGGLSW